MRKEKKKKKKEEERNDKKEGGGRREKGEGTREEILLVDTFRSSSLGDSKVYIR